MPMDDVSEDVTAEAYREAREILEQEGRRELREQEEMILEGVQEARLAARRAWEAKLYWDLYAGAVNEAGTDGSVVEGVPAETEIGEKPDVPLVMKGPGLWFLAESAELCLSEHALPLGMERPPEHAVEVTAETQWEAVGETVGERVAKCEVRLQETASQLDGLEKRRLAYGEVRERLAMGEPMPWEEEESEEQDVRTWRCVEAVLGAAEELDEDQWKRQRLLKRAAEATGEAGSAPHKNVRNVLEGEGLYPVGDGPGRPSDEKSRQLAEEMVCRCREWKNGKTKNEMRS